MKRAGEAALLFLISPFLLVLLSVGFIGSILRDCRK